MVIKDSIAVIAEKYGLLYKGIDFQTKIKDTIVEILNQIPKEKKVVVRGAGEHTRELFMLKNCNIEFENIFDYSVEEREIRMIAERERHIYPVSMLSEFGADIVIISSYTHRKEIRTELEQLKGNFEIIDIYNELQGKGLYVNAPFYRNAGDTYENVIYFRDLYFKEKNAENLKNLIVAYLNIYDFINFVKFTEEYIMHRYSDYQKLECALNEITEILSKVRMKIKARQQRDIIVIWNDQVGYQDLPLASAMYEESKNSLFFENMYTMTPFTVPTFLEMFMKLKPIDDGIYHKAFPVFDRTNSKMLRTIYDGGYEFVYIGDEADAKLFEPEVVMPNYTYNSSCIRCVDLLQKLLDAKKPVCAFLHALVETHNPYLSGELDKAKWYEWPWFDGTLEEIALLQMKKSLQYWDKQLDYYMKFMSDSSIKIYMSDHGKRYNCQPVWKDATAHIICFVTGKNVPVRRCKKMFSIIDFDELIACAIQNKYDREGMYKDYIVMQERDIFNRAAIRFYVEHNAEECICAFRAVRTKEDLYVKLSSGKKYYFKLPDEETNYIEHASKLRLDWLDSLAGSEFEDVSQYEEELAFFRKQFETHE